MVGGDNVETLLQSELTQTGQYRFARHVLNRSVRACLVVDIEKFWTKNKYSLDGRAGSGDRVVTGESQ